MAALSVTDSAKKIRDRVYIVLVKKSTEVATIIINNNFINCM